MLTKWTIPYLLINVKDLAILNNMILTLVSSAQLINFEYFSNPRLIIASLYIFVFIHLHQIVTSWKRNFPFKVINQVLNWGWRIIKLHYQGIDNNINPSFHLY